MMTQTAHTPGPWKFLQGRYGFQIHGGGHWIANLKCEGCPAHELQNARLIAAAPELLEALILAEVQIESFYTATTTNAKARDDNRAMKRAALENVRAAIAKARGQK